MFQCPQQWPGVQGRPCAGHRGGRVGAGAVWDTGAPVLWPPIPPYALSHTAVGTAVCQPLCWGPQCPTASSQWLEVKAWSGRLVLPGGRGGDGSTHRAWHRQGRDAWVSSERDFHVGRRVVQERGQQELSHTHSSSGQMKGEPGRSSSRQEVSSRLGCLRKQAGLSHLRAPPLLPVPAAHTQPRRCPARSFRDRLGLLPGSLPTGDGGRCPTG